MLDGFFGVSGPGVRTGSGLDRKRGTDLARRAIGAVLHFGLVQVRDAQRFLHPQRRRGHASTGSLVGLLILSSARSIWP